MKLVKILCLGIVLTVCLIGCKKELIELDEKAVGWKGVDESMKVLDNKLSKMLEKAKID